MRSGCSTSAASSPAWRAGPRSPPGRPGSRSSPGRRTTWPQASRPGARRAAIALSAGFGLGPLVAGLIAQWAPDALVSAYLPHLVVIAAALAVVLAAPETVGEANGGRRLSVPASTRHMRFLLIVLPSAPWVFIAPSVSFAVLPELVTHSTEGFRVGFAALIAGVTLGVGILIQPLARRLDRTPGVRGMVAGLAAIAAALLLGALAAHCATTRHMRRSSRP